MLSLYEKSAIPTQFTIDKIGDHQNHCKIATEPFPQQTQALIQQARTLAEEVGVTVTTDAYKVLIDYTGNHTRLIFTELEKLKTYALGKTVNGDMVKELVSESAANSLQLANAIRLGNIAQALELGDRLINCNEPAFKITATLTTTFRTWLTVKQMIITGCQDDNTIAQLADVKNPKRLYYIRQEVANCCVNKLKNSLKMLLELELMLKSGVDEKLALQTQIIKLCS